MKRTLPIGLFLFLLICTGSILLSAQDDPITESIIPQRGYLLEIDGVEHELVMGKPVDVVVAGKSHRVLLKEKPYTTHNYKGVTFEFPSQLLSTVDQADPEYTQWSVEGPNAVLMLFCFKGDPQHKVMHATMLQSMKDQYADLSVKQSSVQFKSKPGVELSGERLKVNLVEIKLIQDIYSFSHRGDSYVLILQDTLLDDGSNSEDYKALLKQFTNTFAIDK